MSPTNLTHGKTYLYNNELKLKYSHQTINHYVFEPVDYPDDGYWKITYSDLKDKLTEI